MRLDGGVQEEGPSATSPGAGAVSFGYQSEANDVFQTKRPASKALEIRRLALSRGGRNRKPVGHGQGGALICF
jgi:hypothetical protein